MRGKQEISFAERWTVIMTLSTAILSVRFNDGSRFYFCFLDEHVNPSTSTVTEQKCYQKLHSTPYIILPDF